MNETQLLFLTPLFQESKFVLIWLFAPIVLAIAYELLCFTVKNKSNQITLKKSFSGILEDNSKPGLLFLSIVFYIIFLSFLSLYIYLMFFKENFSYYDNFQFTHSNLIGKPYYMPIWRDSGRFWPLGLQEYNFLALIGKNFLTYQAFSAFQLLTVIILIYRIFSEFPRQYRILTISLAILIPSFVVSFLGLIYPERNLIFWLSIFVLCRYRLTRSESIYSRTYIYGSLISAQFSLYYKEPVFILIGSFAFTNLVVNFLREKYLLSNFRTLLELTKKYYVDLGLLFLSALYVFLYKVIVLSEITQRYSYNSKGSIVDTLNFYLDKNLLIIVFLIVFSIRFFYLLLLRRMEICFWDLLALSAILYFLTFLGLRMYSKYYLAPVEFIAVLYLSQLTYHSYHYWGRKSINRRTLKRFLFIAVISFTSLSIFYQSIQIVSHEVLIRKSLVFGNMQLANKILEYRKLHDQEKTSLFFSSSTDPYLIMNFGSFLEYLEYRNRVSQYKNGYSESSENFNSLAVLGSKEYKYSFVLKSPLEFNDNLCVEWFYINCFNASNPQPEDLIVLLPGLAKSQDFKNLKENSEVLFSYHHEENFNFIEKILLAISREKNLSHMDVYIFQKVN